MPAGAAGLTALHGRVGVRRGRSTGWAVPPRGSCVVVERARKMGGFRAQDRFRGIQGCAMAMVNEMRELVNQLYNSFSSGEADAWVSRTADDVIVIGTDPDEWWEGRDRV